MQYTASERPRPSILRWTRQMSGPLQQRYPVDVQDPADELTQLLEEAERRRNKTERKRD